MAFLGDCVIVFVSQASGSLNLDMLSRITLLKYISDDILRRRLAVFQQRTLQAL